MNTNAKIFIGVIVVLILGVVLTVMLGVGSTARVQGPGEYDAFAQCLADKGALFYGAFWCPACRAQKEMFGFSEKYLPYVECSLPSGQGQTERCIAEGITSYPAWKFVDGTEETGVMTFEQLAAKTSCALPVVAE